MTRKQKRIHIGIQEFELKVAKANDSWETPVKVDQVLVKKIKNELFEKIVKIIMNLDDASSPIDLSRYTLHQLYNYYYLLYFELIDLRDPMEKALRPSLYWMNATKEIDVYMLYAIKYEEALFKQNDLLKNEQKKRRGLSDAQLTVDEKYEALALSIEYILDNLKLYTKNPKLHEALELRLTNNSIEDLYQKLRICGLNFLNLDRTRYTMFETILLAPFKIETNELKQKYQRLLIDMDHIADADEYKIRKSFLKVNERNALQYIWTLYCHYLAFDEDSLRHFLRYFFSSSLTGSGNMLKDHFKYYESSKHGDKLDRRISLLVPLPELELIKDFSKADNDYNIL